MQINNFKFIIFIVITIIIQVVISIFSNIAIDLLGIILVILFLYGVNSLRASLILTIISDLFSHWYLGSHLFAIILLSFMTEKLINHFRISYHVQKLLLLIIFYSIFTAFIILINSIFHNYTFNLLEYSINVIIMCPIMLNRTHYYLFDINKIDNY